MNLPLSNEEIAAINKQRLEAVEKGLVPFYQPYIPLMSTRVVDDQGDYMNYTLDELKKIAFLLDGASQEEINRLGAKGFDLERELAKHIMPPLSADCTEEELLAWGAEFKKRATGILETLRIVKQA